MKPSWVAVIRRSTSGRIDRYSAVSPLITGLGNGLGQVSFSSLPAFDIRTSGCVPPPENSRSDSVAFGATAPPDVGSSPVSIVRQEPFLRVRTGLVWVVDTRVPSGLADTSLDSSWSEGTFTSLPLRFASATASDSAVSPWPGEASPRSDCAPDAARPLAAAGS
ncbi:hypothetical protein GCM10010388_42870 [Streptomyces mauvecolor]